MYIEPNSVIRLLKGVPLDRTYQHTIHFTTTAEQTTYFRAHQKFQFVNQYYSRPNRGWVRIQKSADDLYDCNYIMFQNTSYGDKWFYGFINQINWINNEVAEIQFELDDLQTWYFDYTLEPSFVDREHTLSDNLFEHTLDEGLPTGELKTTTINDCTDIGWRAVMICSEAYDDTILPHTPGSAVATILPFVVGNLPSCGCVWKIVDGTFLDVAKTLYSIATQYNTHDKLEAIMSAYLVPSFAVNNVSSDIDVLVPDVVSTGATRHAYVCYNTSDSSLASHTRTLSPNFNSIDGYEPKNKKLFSYPYNSLLVSNNEGSGSELRFEFFNTNSYQFTEYCCIFPLTEGASLPLQYYNNSTASPNDKQRMLRKQVFPTIQLSGDVMRSWFARQKSNIANNFAHIASKSLGALMLGGASNVASGFVNSVPTTTALSVPTTAVGFPENAPLRIPNISQPSNTTNQQPQKPTMPELIGNKVGEGVLASMLPAPVLTTASGGGLAIGTNTGWFSYQQKTIRQEVAKTIDDYFSMFGYKCSRLKVPNTHVRENWTYTKTIGCNAIGTTGVPSDALDHICSIFDNGITFWANGWEVGNYSLSNRPLSEVTA